MNGPNASIGTQVLRQWNFNCVVQACTFLLQKDLGPMTKIRSLTVFVLRLILVERFFFHGA